SSACAGRDRASHGRRARGPRWRGARLRTPAAAGARHPSVRHWPPRTHGLALSRRAGARRTHAPCDALRQPVPAAAPPDDYAAGDRGSAPRGGHRRRRRQSGHRRTRARRSPRSARAARPTRARRRVVPRSRRCVEARAGAGMRVLAGDIGGTHARLAVVDVDERRVHIVREARYPSSEYPSLAPVVRTFLDAGSDAPERAAFGVAGPVSEGRVSTPNLPWTLDERRLSREIGIPRARLLN